MPINSVNRQFDKIGGSFYFWSLVQKLSLQIISEGNYIPKVSEINMEEALQRSGKTQKFEDGILDIDISNFFDPSEKEDIQGVINIYWEPIFRNNMDYLNYTTILKFCPQKALPVIYKENTKLDSSLSITSYEIPYELIWVFLKQSVNKFIRDLEAKIDYIDLKKIYKIDPLTLTKYRLRRRKKSSSSAAKSKDIDTNINEANDADGYYTAEDMVEPSWDFNILAGLVLNKNRKTKDLKIIENNGILKLYRAEQRAIPSIIEKWTRTIDYKYYKLGFALGFELIYENNSWAIKLFVRKIQSLNNTTNKTEKLYLKEIWGALKLVDEFKVDEQVWGDILSRIQHIMLFSQLSNSFEYDHKYPNRQKSKTTAENPPDLDLERLYPIITMFFRDILKVLYTFGEHFNAFHRILEQEYPSEIDINVKEAAYFLENISELLRLNGFFIQIPEDFRIAGKRKLEIKYYIANSASEIDQDHGLEDKISPVSYDEMVLNQKYYGTWRFYLNQKEINVEETNKIISSNIPLFKMDDQWYWLDINQINAISRITKLNSKRQRELKKKIILEKQYDELSAIEAITLGLNGKKVIYTDKKTYYFNVEIAEPLFSVIQILKGKKKIQLYTQPKLLTGKLRDYQLYGFNWLKIMTDLGFGVILADDMGLGKTIQFISLIAHLKEQHESLEDKQISARPPLNVLVICPTSVIFNWKREFNRFAPSINIFLYYGSKRPNKKEDLEKVLNSNDVLITSYSLIRRDIDLFLKFKWTVVGLDEAQNIKNYGSKQTKAIYKLGSNAIRRIELTGTPIENHIIELWSLFNFINPNLLGSRGYFLRKYFVAIENLGDPIVSRELKNLITPFIMRRMKTDKNIVDELPDKEEYKLYTYLTPIQQKMYKNLVKDYMTQINALKEGKKVTNLLATSNTSQLSDMSPDQIDVAQNNYNNNNNPSNTEITKVNSDTSINFKRSGLILNLLMRLKQLCNHPLQLIDYLESQQEKYSSLLKQLKKIQNAYQSISNITKISTTAATNSKTINDNLDIMIESSGKLASLMDLLGKVIENNEKVLIFTQFRKAGELLYHIVQNYFSITPLYIHGGVPLKKRDEIINLFQHYQEDGNFKENKENDFPILILSLKAAGTGLNLTAAHIIVHFDRWWNPAVEDQATDRAYRIGQEKNVMVYKIVTSGTIEEKIDELISRKKELAKELIQEKSESWITKLNNKELKKLFELEQT
ncbi:MAG: SNF2-related protein [Promethearchaeota archaeon]